MELRKRAMKKRWLILISGGAQDPVRARRSARLTSAASLDEIRKSDNGHRRRLRDASCYNTTSVNAKNDFQK